MPLKVVFFFEEIWFEYVHVKEIGANQREWEYKKREQLIQAGGKLWIKPH